MIGKNLMVVLEANDSYVRNLRTNYIYRLEKLNDTNNALHATGRYSFWVAIGKRLLQYSKQNFTLEKET